MKKVLTNPLIIALLLITAFLAVIAIRTPAPKAASEEQPVVTETVSGQPEVPLGYAPQPVEAKSNELRFQISGVSLAGQRPLPPVPPKARERQAAAQSNSVGSEQSVQQ